jgi:hypothetical protein
MQFGENSSGVVDRFRTTEARDALEELFQLLVFVQSVECPSQDMTIDFR